MFKTILVPTDGSDQAMLGVRYATDLAKRHDAVLYGLYVVDVKLLEGPILRDISASLGTAPYVNYQGNIAMILEERGNAALEALRKTCEQAGVHCETSQTTGNVVRTIVERSETVDLTVMGRSGEHSEWLDGLIGSTTAGVVRRAESPVIVTGDDTFEAGRFLFAYDGSRHANAALQIVAAIWASWHVPFHVLVVGEDRDQALLHEAQSYLESHGVEAEYILRGGDPGETIVEYARECDAGLLVMGSYGHSKVREFVVGSTTAYAMNHSPCPLLMTR